MTCTVRVANCHECSIRVQPTARVHTRGAALPWQLVWPLYALTLLAICFGAVFLAPRSVERAAQDGDAEQFFYGVGAREQSGEQSFRWTERNWGVALFGQPFDAPVLVTLQASATRPADQPLAQLRLMGLPEDGAFEIAREPRVYHLITRPRSDTGGRQRITFTGSVWAPASGDGRALGIAVSWLRVTQLDQAPLLLLANRGLFFAALALAASIALRQLELPRGAAFAAGAIIALVLGVLHMRDAQTLGFLLPSVWWMVAGLGAALAIIEFRVQSSEFRVRLKFGKSQRFLGLAFALVGTLALWLQVLPVWLGVGLAVAGALVVALAEPTNDERPTTNDEQLSFYRFTALPLYRFTALPLLLITLIALCLRLFRLNDQPMALWRDEVYHAELALRIWRESSFRPVYVSDVDLPALLFYLLAPPIGLFGADLWTLRMMPALAGTLTPLALWFALRPIFGGRVAVVAAWCMAVAAWSLYMSRWTFPVIFDPLLTLLAIGCLWRALGKTTEDRRQKTEVRSQEPEASTQHSALSTRHSALSTQASVLWKMGWAAVGGACTGLVMYTYHTGRIEPLVVGMFAVVRLIASLEPAICWRERARNVVRSAASVRWQLCVALIAFGLTVAPLAYFALTNPEAFSKRLDRVNIFNGPDTAPTAPLTVLADQLGRHALMWNVRGDQNARHYAPFRPMLDPFSGALLLVGIAGCLLRRRGATTAALLLWLGIGLVPGVLSDVAPHAMRTIGALAPACALVAIGFESIFTAKSTKSAKDLKYSFVLSSRPSRSSRLNLTLTGGLLAGMLVWNTTLYFGVTSDLREYYYHFETQRSLLARAAREVAANYPDVRVYLPDTLRQGKAGQATTLLLNDAPVGWLNRGRLDPAPEARALLLLPGDLDPAQLAQAQQALGPGAALLRTGPPIPFQNMPIYLVYGTGPNIQTIADKLPLP